MNFYPKTYNKRNEPIMHPSLINMEQTIIMKYIYHMNSNDIKQPNLSESGSKVPKGFK